MKKRWPLISVLFACITLVSSLFVAFAVNGRPISTVESAELLKWGAIDGPTFYSGELWRLLSSQLVHSKQLHMLGNVVVGFILCIALEGVIGRSKLALIYWIGGTLGIVASVVALPQLVSSGSSQALMALCAAVIYLGLRSRDISKGVWRLALATVVFQLALDISVAHYPKPGHVLGFIAGFCLIYFFSRRLVSRAPVI